MYFCERTGIGKEFFFRLGFRMGFSNLEFLGQIASFERCLRGAASMPVDLPYPFHTWPRTPMEAARDMREVAQILRVWAVLSSSF